MGLVPLLLLLALICFALAAIGVDLGRVNVTALGLALLAGAFLIQAGGV